MLKAFRFLILPLWTALAVCFFLYTHPLEHILLKLCLLGLEFMTNFSPSARLLEAGRSACCVILLSAALTVTGRWTIHRWVSESLNARIPALGLAAALGALSTATALINFAGLANRAAAWTIYIAVLGGAVILVAGSKTRTWLDCPGWRGMPALGKFGVCAVMGILALGIACPEIFYDSLYYHLMYPALYRIHGGFVASPESFYAAFPQTAEMLYLFGLLLENEMMAKTFQWIIAVAIGWLFVSAAGTAPGRRVAGLLAFFAFFSIPMVAFNIWNCFVDSATALFAWAALLALVNAHRSFKLNRGGGRALVLAGLLGGWAAGTKYSAFVSGAVLLILFARAQLKLPGSTVGATLRRVGILAAAMAITLSLWTARNVMVYGHPLYPFFVFDAADAKKVEGKAMLWKEGGGHDVTEWIHRPADAVRAIAGPAWWIIQSGTRTADGSFYTPNVADQPGLWLLFAVPFLFARPKPAEDPDDDFGDICGWARWYVLSVYLVWIITGGLPRFLIHMFVPLSFVASAALCGLWRGDGTPAKDPSPRPLVCAAVAVAISFMNMLGDFRQTPGRAVMLGQISEGDFLRDARPLYPAPAYAGYDYLNRNAPPDAKVLVVGDARGYYLDREFNCVSAHDPQPFARMLRLSSDEEQFYRKLRTRGFDHIVVNAAEMRRTLSYGLFPWTDDDRRTLEAFMSKHTRLEYAHVSATGGAAVYVYRLVDAAENGPPPIPEILLYPVQSSKPDRVATPQSGGSPRGDPPQGGREVASEPRRN